MSEAVCQVVDLTPAAGGTIVHLRLRLLRLDDNHPSRPPDSDQAAPPDERPEEPDERPPERPEQPDRSEKLDDAEQPDGGPDLDKSGADGHGLGSDGADPLTLPGLRGSSEAYRPWFMGSDPGVPWFADE